MASYSREVISNVIAASDLSQIVGATVELRSAGGGRLEGLCPFHSEKTPSFKVDPHRQTYHCFGCGAHGDALSFIQERDGLSFVEALRYLADRAGIRLPAPSERENREDLQRVELLKLGAFALKTYRDTLNDPLRGSKGRQYLKGRTLPPKTLETFAVGYATDAWSGLADAAREAGFSERLLEQSGLARKSRRGTLVDFFRDRLIFPIRDASGNVLAFGGRDLSGEARGKYINTPENAAYKKSRVLYGLYEGREALRKAKRAVLVEGYFDAMRCHEAGAQNALAPCGTALTEEQAKLIARYVSEAVVVFDGDAAGVKAASRSIAVLTAAGLSVFAAVLPEGMDPDDFIQARGAEAFLQTVEEARDFVTFYARANAHRADTIEGRTQIARELFAILGRMNDPMRCDEYLRRLAGELKLREWTVRQEFSRYQNGAEQREAVRASAPEVPGEERSRREDEEVLAVVLADDAWRAQALRKLEALAGAYGGGLTQDALPSAALFEALGAVAEKGPEVRPRDIESEAAQRLLTAAAALEPPKGEDREERMRKRLTALEYEVLRAEAARLQQAIREAGGPEGPGLEELLVRKARVASQMKAVAAGR